MTLFMIGTGLGIKSITLEAVNVIKGCDYIFLEKYTSVLNYEVSDLEDLFGKKVSILYREDVENNPEFIELAKEHDVAFLVVGDVFSATTHSDAYLRALKEKVSVKILNNASILNVIGNTGLDLYKFGRTTSIVFLQENWLPKSPYDVIKINLKNNLHTLCLLDIKVREPSADNLKKGLSKYEEPRFMRVKDAIDVLLTLENEFGEKVISKDTLAVGVARLGQDQIIKFDTLQNLKKIDFGEPLHSLVIPGKLSDFEKEILDIHHNIY